jgi:hypothetical protein
MLPFYVHSMYIITSNSAAGIGTGKSSPVSTSFNQ